MSVWTITNLYSLLHAPNYSVIFFCDYQRKPDSNVGISAQK